MTDLLRAAWHYRRSAILLSLLLMPLVAVTVLLIPPKFDSTAQILVRVDRPTIVINSAIHELQSVPLRAPRLPDVGSVKELILSRVMVERVVDKLGVDRILRPPNRVSVFFDSAWRTIPKDVFSDLAARIHRTFSEADYQAEIRREEALASVFTMTDIRVPSDAPIILLRARTGNPFLSRDLMHTFLNEYQKFHAEAFPETGSADFWIVQPASLELKEVSPMRWTLLALGMLLALVIGLGQALVRGVLARTRRVPSAARYDDWYSGDDGDHEAQPSLAERESDSVVNLPR